MWTTNSSSEIIIKNDMKLYRKEIKCRTKFNASVFYNSTLEMKIFYASISFNYTSCIIVCRERWGSYGQGCLTI
jgi:hypothetical protein